MNRTVTPGLHLDGLRLSHDGPAVIDGLSLDVAPGELLVLTGPSGGGKSTLLRAIAGLLPPDAGDIQLDGQSLNRQPPGQRPVAMVFQQPALLPHLSVLDNLCFGLRARGVSRRDAERQAREAARTLELSDLLTRPPRTLSGGEQQRVALGRALLRHPRVFLLDEPLSAVDAPTRARLRQAIVDLHRQLGTSTVYVTHDQAEALAVADRIALLHQGRLQQVDTPRALYAQPANRFVAGFVGYPAMQWLDLTRDGDGLFWQQQRLPLPNVGSPLPILGVRAEHVGLEGAFWHPPRHADAPTFSATVTATEPAGDRQFVWLACDGTPLVARTEPTFQTTPGQVLTAWLDPAGCQLFDTASGTRLP